MMTTRPATASVSTVRERPERAVDLPRRDAWVDNLRVAVIVGVVGAHISLIYALDVAWYYEERTASGLATAILAAVFTPGLLFAMGMLFFVAGLFAPPALDRKGTRRFVVDRLWRLGIPAAVYLLVVNPTLNLVGSRAVGEQLAVADYLRLAYWDDVEFGIAWFLVALLAFSLVYAVWRSRHPSLENPVPLRRSDLLKAAAFLAVASFLVRLQFPVLSGDAALAANLWEYPQMAALFALGVLAKERAWLADGLSPQLRRSCGRAAAVGLVLAGLAGVGIALSDDVDPFLGGFHLEATLIPVIEATLALGMSLWLIDWFRRRASRPGPLVRGLGRASYGAYLVHVPITIVLAVALRDVGLPAELKFLFVYAVGVAASFGIGWWISSSRAATRVL